MLIETPSRLHFTLIDLNGKLGRIDGGVGVALEYPKVVLKAKHARELKISPNYEIVRTAVKKVGEKFKITGKFDIRIIESIPQHVGLGSGTQLSLATGLSLAKLENMEISIRKLAEAVNRGGTSGIGVAAFQRGGFLLDCGHSFGSKGQKQSFLPSHFSGAPPAPLLLRYKFPEDWIFVVAKPNVKKRIHGLKESKIFSQFCPIREVEVERLSRLILMKLLPSLVEKDIIIFGSALTEVQKIGFKKIEVKLQDPIVKQTMEFMVKNGAYGSGMSSFGPTVYGLVLGEKHAKELTLATQEFVRSKIGGKVFYSRCRNKGADVRIIS
ncbi:MAG: beta-ribofuranosylaminobenzene 5'-phosphate synthase [Candidatus Bathyarchaeia archaeon]